MKRLLALVLSLLVHALTLAFIVVGGAIIANFSGHLPAWLIGGVFVTIGVLLRPRLDRMPADAEVLDRSSSSELYGAAARVADSMGVRRPEIVAVTDLGVDAAYSRIGLRRTPALIIGLPLWLALTPRQRVTLLARTYAATVNNQGLIVEGALFTLAEWKEAMIGPEPETGRAEARALMDRATLGTMHTPGAAYEAGGFLGRIIGRVLGGPVVLYEYALTRLAGAGESRTVERMRGLARKVASEQELEALEELMASGSYLAPIQAAALRGESVPEIRLDALTRSRLSDDGVLTSAPGSELLGTRESDLIDGELLKHYTRAIRGFGLIT